MPGVYPREVDVGVPGPAVGEPRAYPLCMLGMGKSTTTERGLGCAARGLGAARRSGLEKTGVLCCPGSGVDPERTGEGPRTDVGERVEMCSGGVETGMGGAMGEYDPCDVGEYDSCESDSGTREPWGGGARGDVGDARACCFPCAWAPGARCCCCGCDWGAAGLNVMGSSS